MFHLIDARTGSTDICKVDAHLDGAVALTRALAGVATVGDAPTFEPPDALRSTWTAVHQLHGYFARYTGAKNDGSPLRRAASWRKRRRFTIQ